MTTDNLPAVREEREDRAPARADTDSWIEVVGEVAKFAGYIAGTEFVPRSLRDSPAAATAAIMYGREVGLPPMTSLTQTHVIEGRPSMSAEAMRALVLAAGHEIEFLESTGAVCRMRARRRGSETWSAEVMWTIDMARAAGLTSKNNWKNYPRQMLTARASAELCTRDFPDVVLGFKAVEEMEDLGGEEQAPAEIASSTRVTRSTRTPAKKAAAALPAPEQPAERPAAPAGPPLPGEDGYDSTPAPEPEPAPEPSEEPSDDGDPSATAKGKGEADEPAGNDGEGGSSDAPPEDEESRGSSSKGVRKASRAQHRMIFASLGELYGENVGDEERLLVATIITGRPIESFNDLKVDEAKAIIDTLARVKDRGQLSRLLDTIEETRQAEAAQEQADAEGGSDD